MMRFVRSSFLADKIGKRYGKGEGLRVLADGKQIAAVDSLAKLSGHLPAR